jgi:glycosyltransferase involved in cell wall biosynthesis
MHSIHATRWIENLKDTSFEMYWFDVLCMGKLDTTDNVKQYVNWNKRKIPYLKGEYFLSKKFPTLFKMVQPFIENTVAQQLEKIILEIKPDIIHSFEMQSCSYPILETMKKYKNINWIYSCWGSDLFYYQKLNEHNVKIKQVLKRIDFLHTDCFRDYNIAKNLGFGGIHIGPIPGGSGYKLDDLRIIKQPLDSRNVILVKGYQHLFGRGLVVLKALMQIQDELSDYKIIIFGAHPKVIEFVNHNNLPFLIYDRNALTHNDILKLMGKAKIYIGNSISDGIPNTLLEAIVMGAFPIQSNPGGATQEIITGGYNGFLIKKPDSIEEVKKVILKAIHSSDFIYTAIKINEQLAHDRYEYKKIQAKVISVYENILNYKK